VRSDGPAPTVQAPTRASRPTEGAAVRILLIILVILAIIYLAQLVLKKR
jgi:Tfp pilus assembly protein PilX